MSKTITISTTVHSPLAHAWKTFTDPSDIVQWNFASDDWECPASQNDLREGGNFVAKMAAKDGSMEFDFGGTYTKVQHHSHFEYTIGDGRSVRVEFEALGPNQTKISEIFEMESTHSEEQQREGWQAILENYKKHAEATA